MYEKNWFAGLNAVERALRWALTSGSAMDTFWRMINLYEGEVTACLPIATD